MKVKFKFAATVLAAVLLGVTPIAGCINDAPKNFTIQYTDDNGTHQLMVTGGESYVLESVPQRTGYDFLGLFDQIEGGKQYITAQGNSLAVFNNNLNIVCSLSGKPDSTA